MNSPTTGRFAARAARCGRSPAAGFTVIEVFMVVLLLASVLALVIVNFFPFQGALDERPAKDQAWRAIAEAHRLARAERSTVLLHYDEEAESLVLADGFGREAARFRFPQGTDAGVEFYRILPEKEMREEPDFEAEDEAVEILAFQPYGATAPFQMEIETGTDAITFRFDPFSGLSWEETDLF